MQVAIEVVLVRVRDETAVVLAVHDAIAVRVRVVRVGAAVDLLAVEQSVVVRVAVEVVREPVTIAIAIPLIDIEEVISIIIGVT